MDGTCNMRKMKRKIMKYLDRIISKCEITCVSIDWMGNTGMGV
jgi:hypothetical protein